MKARVDGSLMGSNSHRFKYKPDVYRLDFKITSFKEKNSNSISWISLARSCSQGPMQ